MVAEPPVLDAFTMGKSEHIVATATSMPTDSALRVGRNRPQGSESVFPGFAQHQVTPNKRGTLRSLTAKALGG